MEKGVGLDDLNYPFQFNHVAIPLLPYSTVLSTEILNHPHHGCSKGPFPKGNWIFFLANVSLLIRGTEEAS